MSITVKNVRSSKDLNRFINFTREVYKDDPNWIQPLDLFIKDTLDFKKNPFFLHAEAELFIAEKQGKIVGRISAQFDQRAQKQWGPNLGYFGFFEATEKEATFLLFQAAEKWLRTKGAKTVQGPWSLSPKEECGLLIEGFDTPPCFMMPHGRPEYNNWIKAAGYSKAHDLNAYQLDLMKGWPEKTKRIIKAAERNNNLILREADMSRINEEVSLMVDIVGDAWSENWGFTSFTVEEAKHLASNLKYILKPHRTVFAEYKGETVGFMATLPDLNADIYDFNGKLFPFNFVKLLKRRLLSKTEGRMRVPLMGVRKSIQKRPIGAATALWMIDYSTQNVMKRGAFWGELGWILDINHGMNSILNDIGSEKYKIYRIYEKKI